VEGDVQPRWIAMFWGADGSIPADATFSPDGELALVTGTMNAVSSKTSIATVAYDVASGERIWNAHYRPLRDAGTVASRMVVCPHGERLFITGWRYGRGPTSAVTLAYDIRSGKLLWNSEYLEENTLSGQGKEILVTGDGETIFVLVQVGALPPEGGTAVIALEASTGRILWNFDGRVEANRISKGRMAQGVDGELLFLSGAEREKGVVVAWRLFALDVLSGQPAWSAFETVAGGIEPQDLTLSSCGTSLFVGGDFPFPEAERGGLHLSSWDIATASRTWSHSYFPSRALTLKSMDAAKAPCGTEMVILIANEVCAVEGESYLISAVRAEDGGAVWDRTGAAGVHPAPPIHAVAKNHGVVTVVSTGSDELPVAVAKFELSGGNSEWNLRSGFGQPAGIHPRALAVSPDRKNVLLSGMVSFRADGKRGYGTALYHVAPDHDAPAQRID